MSKSIASVLGIVLALAGFALGRYTGSQSERGALSARARGPAAGGAISEALGEKDPIARGARLAALLQGLGPEAEPEVREILTRPQFDYGMAELELLVRFWARHDAKAAANWALSAPPPGCTIAAISPSVEAWATLEPRAVAEFLHTNVRGPDSIPADLALVRGWFASGEPGVEEYLRDMGIGFERQRAVGAFASLMLQRDGPEAVQRWAEGVSDEDAIFKLDVFRQVGGELGNAAPEAATAWCDEHCDGPYGKNLRALIALYWAARDPKAVMEWLAAAPEGQERDHAVKAAYGAWMRRDSDAATAWVTAMGIDAVPSWFLPAVGTYAMTMARDNHAREAIEWCKLIPDEENRELALIAAFKHWRYRDEAAAEAWLSQSPLSEEAREKARKRAPTERPSLAPKAPPT